MTLTIVVTVGKCQVVLLIIINVKNLIIIFGKVKCSNKTRLTIDVYVRQSWHSTDYNKHIWFFNTMTSSFKFHKKF